MTKRKKKTEDEREKEALQPEDEGTEKHMTVRDSFAKARTNLHDEMMSIAKREARDGETAEQSLVRLIDQRDPRISHMYEAANVIKSLDDPSRDGSKPSRSCSRWPRPRLHARATANRKPQRGSCATTRTTARRTRSTRGSSEHRRLVATWTPGSFGHLDPGVYTLLMSWRVVEDAHRVVRGQPPMCTAEEYMAAGSSPVLILAARRAEAYDALTAYDREPNEMNLRIAVDAMLVRRSAAVATNPLGRQWLASCLLSRPEKRLRASHSAGFVCSEASHLGRDPGPRARPPLQEGRGSPVGARRGVRSMNPLHLAQKAIELEPRLTAFGLGVYGRQRRDAVEEFIRSRDRLLSREGLQEIAFCAQWLRDGHATGDRCSYASSTRSRTTTTRTSPTAR